MGMSWSYKSEELRRGVKLPLKMLIS